VKPRSMARCEDGVGGGFGVGVGVSVKPRSMARCEDTELTAV